MKFNMFKLGDKNKNTAPGKTSQNKTDAGETDVDISKIVDVAPARPHGPAEELTLGDGLNDDIALDEIDESAEDIKLGEVKLPEKNKGKVSAYKTASAPVSGTEPPAAQSAATQPAAIKEEEKSGDSGKNDLNSLFSTDEEEENPLAALINSMPDVTAREILDDIEEIHRIIKEWKPNQGGGGIPR